ncbi:MAG: hypothetical protein K2O18_01625 [Oscillospiraceae bacterium]|nr:hypothetical protein [Oscillospiraceae bacterium]
MKLRNKIILSVLVGLTAMLFSSLPVWWGVLFSPLAEPLTTAEAPVTANGPVWTVEDGTQLRLKSLDLLLSGLETAFS